MALDSTLRIMMGRSPLLPTTGVGVANLLVRRNVVYETFVPVCVPMPDLANKSGTGTHTHPLPISPFFHNGELLILLPQMQWAFDFTPCEGHAPADNLVLVG
jgi:hypothetical protein